MSLQAQLNSTSLPSEIDPPKAVGAFMTQRNALTLLLPSNLPNIASKLYTQSIISQDALAEAMNQTHIASVRTVSLLSVVEAKIKAEPHVFTEFVKIMESEPSLKSQATELVKNYLHGLINVSPVQSATSSVMSRYGDYLEGVYSRSPVSSDGKFPPTPSKKYIKLAVVKHGSKLRDLEELMKSTLDRRLFNRKRIDINDILKNGDQVTLVFVEGPPGIGKSTLAWELCRRWDRKQYDLAVLLRLREREVQQIENIADLFPHDDKSLQQSVAKEVIGREGKKVLFILDGYDELPPKLRQTGLLARLLSGRSLPKCTVLVTSRPSATHDLYLNCRPQIQRHIEILGFTEHRVHEYAKSIFTEREVLNDFLCYISASKNPAINSLMYIPLNAAIIVEIYRTNKRKDCPMPTTMTQLYTQLCLTLLQRYLKSIDPHNVATIVKFSDLPSTYYTHFKRLSQLAFESFEQGKIILYSDSVPEELVHFGFFDSVPALYGGGGVSYNFLHLTLQEFLAAYHITQLSNGTEVFSRCCKNKRWDIVWRFVSGLTRFEYFKDSVRSDAFADVTEDGLKVKNLLMQCLFEAQIRFDCISEKNSIAMDSDSLFPLDGYALGYCIVNSSSTTSWTVKVDGRSGKTFMDALNSDCPGNHGIISHLETVDVVPFCLYDKNILHGVNHLKIDFSECIFGIKVKRMTMDVLMKAIPLMKNLSSLSLPFIVPDLLDIISHSNVTTLELSYDDSWGLTQYGLPSSVFKLINSKLKKLSIRSSLYGHFQRIDHSDCKSLCDVLFGPSSLHHLTLELPNFTENSFDFLETNSCLSEVTILLSGRSLQSLSKILLNNKRIETLSWGINIKEEDLDRKELDDFNTALSSNTTLKKLTLQLLKSNNPDTNSSVFTTSDSRLTIEYVQEFHLAQ